MQRQPGRCSLAHSGSGAEGVGGGVGLGVTWAAGSSLLCHYDDVLLLSLSLSHSFAFVSCFLCARLLLLNLRLLSCFLPLGCCSSAHISPRQTPHSPHTATLLIKPLPASLSSLLPSQLPSSFLLFPSRSPRVPSSGCPRRRPALQLPRILETN